MDRRILGDRIRAVRELRSLSQQDVARVFGCARETVSNWERGERGIEAPELARLAQIFDVDITYFYGAGEYQDGDVPPELQMVYGLQGRVVSHLPPGRARQRYIEGLRAQAESNWELIANRLEEEESEQAGQNAEAAGESKNAGKAGPVKDREVRKEAKREAGKTAGKPQGKQE